MSIYVVVRLLAQFLPHNHPDLTARCYRRKAAPSSFPAKRQQLNREFDGHRIIDIQKKRVPIRIMLDHGPIEILLVEDNAGDIRLTLEAFTDAELPNHVSVVRDGVEALAFLRKEGPYACAPRPDLVLLDLNMPKKDGREVLRDVKTDPELKSIPLIVLTTSVAPADIVKSYDLHANCYLQKPAGYDDFLEMIRQVETLWFSVVQLVPGNKKATA